MSGEDLNREGYCGLFGKLPATGDFVSRGLPDAFRSRWDAWVTRHLAARDRLWPPGGLRFRLVSGDRTALGLVVPSRDAVGRRFPLTALLVLPFAPASGEIDGWCDEALPFLDPAGAAKINADHLWRSLDALRRPAGGGFGPNAPLLLWTAGEAPRAADPSEPEPVLDALLSSPGSSTP